MARRIYDLDAHLLARIEKAQRKMGFPHEVEAVRRLLDRALVQIETEADLLDRLKAGEPARDVVVGHPLVDFIEQDGGEIFAVTLRHAGHISINGED